MKKIKYLVLLAGLSEAAWKDWCREKISNKGIHMLLWIRSSLLFLTYILNKNIWQEELISAVGGMFVIGIIFFSIYYLSRKTIGAGDVKLLTVIGFYCGWERTLWIVLFAAVYALLHFVLQFPKGNWALKSPFPFAPYILSGAVTVILVF